MRRSNQDEYFAWLKKIIKTSLNSKKPIDAVNTFTTPTISYGFAVLDWSVTELEAIDRETRKVLKKYHLLNNNSDVTRLYLPRRDGGRGLVNITHQYKSNCDVQLQLEKHRRSTFNTCVSFASPFTIQVYTRESSEIFWRPWWGRWLSCKQDETSNKEPTDKKRIGQKKQQLFAKEMHGQYLQLLD